MEQALLRHEEFDAFILDEADTCIMEQGSMLDPSTQKFLGFWDLLKKRTFLLTATIGISLEDTLFKLYGIQKKAFEEFGLFIKAQDSTICKSEIDYKTVDTNDKFLIEAKKTIQDYMAERPVIVFVNTKVLANRIKKLCGELSIVPYMLLENHHFSAVKHDIQLTKTGVLIAMDMYGRGADLKFGADSFVLIAFLPDKLDEVLQMTGRSSRTLQTHRS